MVTHPATEYDGEFLMADGGDGCWQASHACYGASGVLDEKVLYGLTGASLLYHSFLFISKKSSFIVSPQFASNAAISMTSDPCSINKTKLNSCWGPWATFGFGVAIYMLFSSLNLAVAVVYYVIDLMMQGGDFIQSTEEFDAWVGGIDTNGTFMALATVFSGTICLFAVWGIINLSNGMKFWEYVGPNKLTWRSALKWGLFTALFLIVLESLTVWLDRSSDFMPLIYESSKSKILLCVAIIGVAPLWEEIFFRGFLFKGFYSSRLGALGTILLTAGLFALIHIQYDWFGMLNVFALGLVLGFARWKTDSIAVCILIHALNNLVATIQTVFLIHGGV